MLDYLNSVPLEESHPENSWKRFRSTEAFITINSMESNILWCLVKEMIFSFIRFYYFSIIQTILNE